MIVTKTWLNEYIDLGNISTDEICIGLNSIGLEVDSVTKPNIAKGVVVGFVKECIKHPDATKLNICQVDIGSEVVQIVCGASNVAAEQYVPVATVGTILSEDFKIKKAKLRGADSFGMICSSTEINLPAINDGILELDNSIGELIIGKELNQYELINDDIIEIELTANRGDCLNIYGVAKELSAYFNIPLREKEFIKIENEKAIGQVLEIESLSSSTSNLLYKVADISQFTLPVLYRLRCSTVGIEKQTDIELLIGYAIHSVGVLLNIYSQPKQINNKSKLKIVIDDNGFTQIIDNEMLSIVGIDNKPLQQLTDIVVLEANYTDPTALAQKVFNTKQKTGDIYYKSSRGSNPDLEFGIKYLIDFLSANGVTIYKGQIDFITDIPQRTIDVDINKINNIIGETIPTLKIENILTSLGFTNLHINNNILTANIPATRHDIVNIADLTEEIVRMVGIDNIQSKPLAIDEVNRTNKISRDLEKKNKIRSLAVANGFFETTTYVFSSKELLEKYGFETVNDDKDILNPITSDLNTFRTTLLLNLIQGISSNIKQGFKSIALFEIGSIFNSNRIESKKVGFVFSGDIEEESLANSGKPKAIDLFGFAQKLTNCIGEFELEEKEDISNKFFHPYQCANIIQNGNVIGFISKLHPSVVTDFDLYGDTFFAQLDFESLKNDLIKANDISKYQSVKRDLSIVVDKSLEYKQIKKVLIDLDIPELQQFNLIDIYSDKSLGDKESLTIKFILQSHNKTLQEEDIVTIMDNILNTLKEQFDITLR